jgi:hypothetical protein
VIVEEVIVVAPSTAAGAGEGSGRMTEQMPTDDTDGDDDALGVDRHGAIDEPLGGGRLTDTMQIDDAEGGEEIRQQDRF